MATSVAAVIGGCLWCDRRRAASWLAGALAWGGGVAAASAADPCRAVALALLVAAAAAVAAGGDPPRGLLPGPPRRVWPWLVARATWPLAGSVAAWCIGPQPAMAGWCAGVAIVGVILTLSALGIAITRCTAPGDAASLALGLGAAAAAAALGVGLIRPTETPRAPLAAAALAWSGCAGLVLAWSAGQGPAPPLSAAATVRRVLVGLEMATAVTGMVAWLVLAPEHAWLYVVLVTAWCLVLTVPQATLADGVGGAAGRRRLLATVEPRLVAGWRGTATHAAILGWPAAVALVVAGGRTAAPAAMACGAALVTSVGVGVVLARWDRFLGWRPETAQAVALAGLSVLEAAWSLQFPASDRG